MNVEELKQRVNYKFRMFGNEKREIRGSSWSYVLARHKNNVKHLCSFIDSVADLIKILEEEGVENMNLIQSKEKLAGIKRVYQQQTRRDGRGEREKIEVVEENVSKMFQFFDGLLEQLESSSINKSNLIRQEELTEKEAQIKELEEVSKKYKQLQKLLNN